MFDGFDWFEVDVEELWMKCESFCKVEGDFDFFKEYDVCVGVLVFKFWVIDNELS